MSWRRTPWGATGSEPFWGARCPGGEVAAFRGDREPAAFIRCRRAPCPAASCTAWRLRAGDRWGPRRGAWRGQCCPLWGSWCSRMPNSCGCQAKMPGKAQAKSVAAGFDFGSVRVGASPTMGQRWRGNSESRDSSRWSDESAGLLEPRAGPRKGNWARPSAGGTQRSTESPVGVIG